MAPDPFDYRITFLSWIIRLLIVIQCWTVASGAASTTHRAARLNAHFLNQKDEAQTVCFVIDAGGSLANIFPDLRARLITAVSALNPDQKFDILFVYGDESCRALGTELVVATPENKRRVEKFLGEPLARGGNPIPALELAARLKPQVIYLLTDGDLEGPGNEKVVEFCKRRFSDAKIRINTLAFVRKERLKQAQNLEFVKSLQSVARNSGGRSTVVSEHDLSEP